MKFTWSDHGLLKSHEILFYTNVLLIKDFVMILTIPSGVNFRVEKGGSVERKRSLFIGSEHLREISHTANSALVRVAITVGKIGDHCAHTIVLFNVGIWKQI